jgi:hypothetical protein
VAAPEEAQPSIELPPLPEAPVAGAASASEPGAEHRIQLPALPRQGTGMVWLRRSAVAAVTLVAVLALLAERQQVMNAVPFTTRFYTLAGLGPAVAGQGLELREVTPSRGADNGVPTLAINGQIANVSSSPRPVPKLRVALRDANNKELQSWEVSVSDEPLAPGASVPFHTTISQPPDGATGVIVSFMASGS